MSTNTKKELIDRVAKTAQSSQARAKVITYSKVQDGKAGVLALLNRQKGRQI